jgi:hypothetical protein
MGRLRDSHRKGGNQNNPGTSQKFSTNPQGSSHRNSKRIPDSEPKNYSGRLRRSFVISLVKKIKENPGLDWILTCTYTQGDLGRSHGDTRGKRV